MLELANEPFVRGINWILNDDDMDFGLLKLQGGEVYESSANYETIYLLLEGSVTFFYHISKTLDCERHDKFNEPPSSVHFSGNQSIILSANSNCELITARIKNDSAFKTEFTLNHPHEGMKLQLSEHIIHEPASIQASTRQLIHIQPKATLTAEHNQKGVRANHPCSFKLIPNDTLSLHSQDAFYLTELIY